MVFAARILGLILSGLLVISCSGTKTSDSWTSQTFKGQIKNVYIIGIAKDNLNRMIFEDAFESRLTKEGLQAISSYKDNLPTGRVVDREDIIQRMRNNNCDSVLLTRLVGRQKKASITGGQGTYTYTPSYPGGVSFHTMPKDSPYFSWHNYYSHASMNYVAPAKAEFVTLIVESVLYDLHTEELIWTAQLETKLEGNIEKMMKTFVEEVTKDLKKKNLI